MKSPSKEQVVHFINHESLKNCKRKMKRKIVVRNAKKNYPEKMGTSMWINRRYPICDQDGDCVEPFAHLVGIVLKNSSPTMGMVEGMLTE
jgi:hypothetical protein